MGPDSMSGETLEAETSWGSVAAPGEATGGGADDGRASGCCVAGSEDNLTQCLFYRDPRCFL